MEILLEHQALAVSRERSVEFGVLLQRHDHRLQQEAQYREADTLLLRLLGLDLAEFLELGDVGLIVLRDVRDGDPVAVQIRARELPDA
jgi:hypothetical protein